MVCANCRSDSHRTGASACPNYCTLCAQPGHRQKRGTCPFRVCSTCHQIGHSARECTLKGVAHQQRNDASTNSCDDRAQHSLSDEVCERCQEHGHNESSCSKPRCKACGSSTHKNAKSFECPEPNALQLETQFSKSLRTRTLRSAHSR